MSKEDFDRACTIRSEFVLAVKGKLVLRTGDMVNANMATGELEVIVSEFKILSKSETPPFDISDDCRATNCCGLSTVISTFDVPACRRNLLMRHKDRVHRAEYFDEQNFVEIETPILTKSTPEGARDYLVPSRVHPGKFYALPQSPQLFKQLLMLAGYDRYFQIARCFRDEDLRADRQPDFTQIDIEMSFVEAEDVQSVNEGFLKRLFKETLDVDIETPLPRIKYADAMARYGSDKPDTRFGLELVDLSDVVKSSEFSVFQNALASGGSVRAVNAKGASASFSRKELDAMGEFVKTYRAKGLIWMNDKADGLASPILKFLSEDEIAAIRKATNLEEGDVLFIIADSNKTVFASLGALRLKLAEKLNLIPKDKYNLLWVTEFPQFEWSEEENRFMAMHHPFTSPLDDDIERLESDPRTFAPRLTTSCSTAWRLAAGRFVSIRRNCKSACSVRSALRTSRRNTDSAS